MRQIWWRWRPVWPWTWWASGWLALWLWPEATYSATAQAYPVAVGIFLLLTPPAACLAGRGSRQVVFVPATVSGAVWAGFVVMHVARTVGDVREHLAYRQWLLLAPFLYPAVFLVPLLFRLLRTPLPASSDSVQSAALPASLKPAARAVLARSVVTVFLVAMSAMFMRDIAAPRRPAFDPAVWQLRVPADRYLDFVEERDRMTPDLARRYLRAGTTADELRALLGPPDSWSADAWAWRIGRPKAERWAPQGLWLTIYLDGGGRFKKLEYRAEPLGSTASDRDHAFVRGDRRPPP